MIREGIVIDTSDPTEQGRIKIWVPSIDGDNYKIENIPWATYVSPFAGSTREYPAGPDSKKTGLIAYGLFVPPKMKALVVVGFFYDDPNRRIYLGSYWREQGNRSLPRGRNKKELSPAPVNDQLDPVEPQYSNLVKQFQNRLTASEAQTRGAYERSTGADDPKNGTEGYGIDQVTPIGEDGKPVLDPQTYALTTPGRHSMIFQDNPKNGRVRIVTAAGHQIILDDANERIYLSTATGKCYFELDQDGRMHGYAAEGLSLSTGGSMNLIAAGNMNLSAGGSMNLSAGGSLKLAGCAATSISGAGVNLESSGGFNILAAGSLLQTASAIHLNGPGAASAQCPDVPDTVPNHEPWVRKASKSKRNPNWKA